MCMFNSFNYFYIKGTHVDLRAGINSNSRGFGKEANGIIMGFAWALVWI